jgi:hypothetical protein
VGFEGPSYRLRELEQAALSSKTRRTARLISDN